MKVEIIQEFIKLSQFLKIIDACPTGGLSKYFLDIHEVKINDRKAGGRNAKIRVGDTVWVDDDVYFVVQKQQNETK
ncbi:RNA-binding S4 domain-containing protein [Mycoplasma struthionis]|uniref:RNA-binding S4 domain-containing protein n=1 Tax=Mycoplasma struthionis TaxID=538220 RepID=A0A3G8LGK7_9MOLU|nr:RNA-binding S4 domain-containing protein [Mycoplasma struthionis]AZG68641.1 RNA-binding S4 domain-containing protein [Mycoplasma struthionis]